MIFKLLTEHYLELLSLKEAAEARPSLHMSKCHIVGNLMHWLIYVWVGLSPCQRIVLMVNYICSHSI